MNHVSGKCPRKLLPWLWYRPSTNTYLLRLFSLCDKLCMISNFTSALDIIRDVDSSSTGDAYIRDWISPSLINICASRQVIIYTAGLLLTGSSVKFESNYNNFRTRILIWKFRLPKCYHFVSASMLNVCCGMSAWVISKASIFINPRSNYVKNLYSANLDKLLYIFIFVSCHTGHTHEPYH